MPLLLKTLGHGLLDRLGLEVRSASPVALRIQAAGGATIGGSGSGGPWVYACVSLVARTVAAAPFRLSRQGQAVKAGPVVDLFERPHPHLSRADFWDVLAQWLLLRGRAYVVGLDRAGSVIPMGHRPPANLLVLPADALRPHLSAGELLGYRFAPGQDCPVRETYLSPEEVIAVRLPSPFELLGCQSPAEVAAVATATDAAAAQLMHGLMLNNGDTGVIVETDQQLSPEQREQVLAALRERKRSAGTADRPLLLWGGLKVTKPTLSTTDLQFLENRKFNRQEICAAFGVPQVLLGFTEDANRSVAQSARVQFIQDTVAPLAQRLAVVMRPVIRSFGSDLVGQFDLAALPVMRAAQRERFAVAGIAQQMGVPLRVANQVFDLGLPALPGDGDAVRPFGVDKVGELPATGESAPNAFERLARHLQRPSPSPASPALPRAESDKLQRGFNR